MYPPVQLLYDNENFKIYLRNQKKILSLENNPSCVCAHVCVYVYTSVCVCVCVCEQWLFLGSRTMCNLFLLCIFLYFLHFS
jgi:hypothetical protein